MIDAQLLYELFASRQSDRKYAATKPVDNRVIQRIVEHALLAPSATNQQPWQIVAVSDDALRERVVSAALKNTLGANRFLREAPVHLFIVGDRPSLLAKTFGEGIRGINYVPYDLGILMAYIVLAAEAEGLGSCIVGWINGSEVAKELGIPKNKKVLFDITLGYSLDAKRSKKRKSPEKSIHYNQW